MACGNLGNFETKLGSIVAVLSEKYWQNNSQNRDEQSLHRNEVMVNEWIENGNLSLSLRLTEY